MTRFVSTLGAVNSVETVVNVGMSESTRRRCRDGCILGCIIITIITVTISIIPIRRIFNWNILDSDVGPTRCQVQILRWRNLPWNPRRLRLRYPPGYATAVVAAPLEQFQRL
jgi:hypothetical protein